jgi:hypothetical protein
LSEVEIAEITKIAEIAEITKIAVRTGYSMK